MIVHRGHLHDELEVPPGESSEGGAQHRDHEGSHLVDLLADRLASGLILRGQEELRDVHRLIGDPFEVQVAVQDRRHETEVCGDGRLQRQQLKGGCIDLQVEVVDLVVALDHGLGHRGIALHDRLDGSLHHGTRELAHGEHLELERPELVVEVLPGLLHQPL